MRIDGGLFEDYGIHARLEFEFGPRLNLICGPNGSGKTTLLGGLQYCLIGSDPFEGRSLADRVRDGAEKAKLTLRFTAAGGPGTVTRTLGAKQTARLEYAGQVWQKAGDVNAELLKLLGCPKAYVERNMFVPQNGMTAWLDMTPAERHADFAKSLGADRLDRAEEAAARVAASVTLPPDLSDELDRAKTELEQAQAALAAADDELAACPDPGPEPEAAVVRAADLRAALAAADAVAGLAAQRRKAEADLADAERRHRAVYDRWAVTEHARLAAVAERDAAAHAAVDARPTLDAWAVYDANERARADYTRDLATLAGWTRRPAPASRSIPGVRSQLAEAEELHSACDQTVALLDEEVKRYADAGTSGVCPVCGSNPTFDMQAKRAEAELLLTEATAQQAEAGRHASQLRSMLAVLEADAAARAEIRRRARTCREFRRHVVPQPELSREDAQRLLVAAQAADQASINAAAVEKTRREETERVAAEVETARAALAKLPHDPGDLDGDPAVLRRELDELVAAAAERAATRSRRGFAQSVRATRNEDVRQKLERYERLYHKSIERERTLAAVARIRAAATALGRKGGAGLFLKRKVERLAADVAEQLAAFDPPFTVEASTDEGLEFLCRFSNGAGIRRDRRISGGQKTTLSWALRFANDRAVTGGRGTGIISLDEPTAGLDARTMGRLPEVLTGLRAAAERRDLQVLFVTHESLLADHFDAVVDLGRSIA